MRCSSGKRSRLKFLSLPAEPRLLRAINPGAIAGHPRQRPILWRAAHSCPDLNGSEPHSRACNYSFEGSSLDPDEGWSHSEPGEDAPVGLRKVIAYNRTGSGDKTTDKFILGLKTLEAKPT
jgi:hypothetical protein